MTQALKSFWQTLIAAGPRMWGLLAAGPVITGLAIYLSEVLRRPVPPQYVGKQLDFQGWALILAIALLGIVVTALAAARVSIKGPGDIHLDADASEH